MAFIDAHVHVWTDQFDYYPVAESCHPADMNPPTFLPEEILAHAEPSGVDRVVLVQMSYYSCDNAYMLSVMDQYPGVFAGIAIVDSDGERPDEQMRQLAGRGVRGFRVSPKRTPPGDWLAGDGFERMFRAGAESQLAICPLINPDALPALSQKCEQFPDTPVIIDHLCRIGAGQPIQEEHIDQLCAMAPHRSVMVKVSAFYALGEKMPPYTDLTHLIQRVYEAFGPERLMWGSDCPYQVMDHTYGDSIRLIRDDLDFLSASDKQQILCKTAERFFFGI